MCGHVGYCVAFHCSLVEELNVWSCWLQCGNPLLSGGGAAGSDGPGGVCREAAGAHVLPDVPHRFLPGLLHRDSIQ